jgi:hypothetical protein
MTGEAAPTASAHKKRPNDGIALEPAKKTKQEKEKYNDMKAQEKSKVKGKEKEKGGLPKSTIGSRKAAPAGTNRTTAPKPSSAPQHVIGSI